MSIIPYQNLKTVTITYNFFWSQACHVKPVLLGGFILEVSGIVEKRYRLSSYTKLQK
jgi:hypothetical protein